MKNITVVSDKYGIKFIFNLGRDMEIKFYAVKKIKPPIKKVVLLRYIHVERWNGKMLTV